MKYRYILFDLDGTLTEPEEGITKCIQYALSKLGIEEPDRKKLCKFIGPPLVPAFMEHYGFDEATARQALLYYRERFLVKGIYENKVYDGIPALLGKLKEQGAHLLLATTKPEPQAMEVMRYFKLAPYFDVIAGSDLNETVVEKPDVMRLAISRLSDYNPDAAVMIGDRKFDIAGAKVHKIASIGVLYGHGSAEELKSAGADCLAESVEMLGNVLFN